MNKRAVIYARFSSHNQNEQSIEGQLHVCYDYAKNNNIDIMGEYIDRAMSGTTDKRPQFLEMIDDSKNGFFDYVLVYQLDRFARNRYDSAIYKAKLKKNNVKVISARETITNDASGILVEGLLESMAEYYSVELAQKVRRGIKENMSKGFYIGGSVTYGYDIVDKRWVINREEAVVVRKIFDLYKDNHKTNQIARYLNNKGIYAKKRKLFDMLMISRIIRNTHYIGLYTKDGKTYNNIVPRIIPDKLFEECNHLMDTHKHRRTRSAGDPFVLSGKLFCGYCGYPMNAESGTSCTGKVYNYYKCYGRKRRKAECEKESIHKEKLEKIVFDATAEYILSPENINEMAKLVTNKFNQEIKSSEIIDVLNAEISKVNYSIKRITNAIMSGVDSEALNAELKALEEQKTKLNNELAVEEARRIKPLDFDSVKKFLKYFASKEYNNPVEKYDFFSHFINKVILYDNRVVIIYNTNDEPNLENLGEDYEKKELKTAKKKSGFDKVMKDSPGLKQFKQPSVRWGECA